MTAKKMRAQFTLTEGDVVVTWQQPDPKVAISCEVEFDGTRFVARGHDGVFVGTGEMPADAALEVFAQWVGTRELKR